MLSRFKFSIVLFSTFLTALLVIGAVMGESSSADGAYRQLSVYTEVLQRIKGDYVEEPDVKQVTEGALQGLLESLDPYSCYLNAEQYKELERRKASQPGTIGVTLLKRGWVYVLSVVPNSPAAKGGLQFGDQVDAVDGKSTRDLPLPLTQAMLNGSVGSTVTVVVRRAKRPDEPQELKLTRATVVPPAPTHKLMDEKVGYLEVRSLSPGRAADVAKAVRELTAQGADKLVLDLRSNASGDLQEGVKLANLFVDSGLIAYAQGQKSPRRDFNADPKQAITKLPLVLITNRSTSGGAELAAAAILDRQRGQIVGERTMGVAAEQKTIPLDDGSAVILSIAKYYRPGGKAIQDGGVNPTLLVLETDGDDDDAPAPPQRQQPGDEPLKKAIEVLKGAAKTAA